MKKKKKKEIEKLYKTNKKKYEKALIVLFIITLFSQ